MRPLRYFINITVDGCCDHRAIPPNEDVHRHAVEVLSQADALLYGRVTYRMMDEAWRSPTQDEGDTRPTWVAAFSQTMNAAKKFVVSGSLQDVDWNAELLQGDLGEAVERLKQGSGKGLLVGGVKLPHALAELGLIDEYEFLVHPRIAGHGPRVFAGVSKQHDLELVGRRDFASGAVALRYKATKGTSLSVV